MTSDTVGDRREWGFLDSPVIIAMRADTAIEREFRLKACAKEPWTADWLATLGTGDLLFNIGANVGSYALLAAARGASVLAVEPHPINVDHLARNAIVNGLGGSQSYGPGCGAITVVLAACGPTVQPWLAGYGRFEAGMADLKLRPVASGEQLASAITIPGTTLDDLAEAYGQPTHLLIDVDGAEREVLRGGAEMLPRVHEVMIEISTDPTISAGCVALMNAAGLSEIGRWDTRGGHQIEDVWYGLYRRA